MRVVKKINAKYKKTLMGFSLGESALNPVVFTGSFLKLKFLALKPLH
jgi:hypothetical protein